MIRALVFIAAAGLVGAPAVGASLSIDSWRSRGVVRYSLDVRHETLGRVAAGLQRRTGLAIRVTENPQQVVSLRVRDGSATELVRYLAAAAGRGYSIRGGGGTIDGRAEPRVDLDVKDADVHEVLDVLRLQCGIRNLVLDPGVEGRATFLFESVPCRTALAAVLRTYSLTTQGEAGEIVSIGGRP